MAVNSFNAQNPPVTTKGDLFTFSTIPTRLGVGANDTVLTADSSTATGLKWAAASSGGLTQIASTSFNNTSGTFDVSSIAGTYKHLLITATGLQASAAASRVLRLRFNNDSGTNYSYAYFRGAATSSLQSSTATNEIELGNSIAFSGDGAVRFAGLWVFIPNYAGAEAKSAQFIFSGYPNGAGIVNQGGGTWSNTTAINRITVLVNSDNYNDGIMTLWGVS